MRFLLVYSLCFSHYLHSVCLSVMSTNNKSCQDNRTVSSCFELSYSKCPHCSLDLCLEHLNVHQQFVRLQFNELIDRINEQKMILKNSSTMIEMKSQALNKLEQWRIHQMETLESIYQTERIHIENVCEQSMREECKIEKTIYEELNILSSTIEKKKNIHPQDIDQLERKLNELNGMTKKIQEITQVELTNIVTNIKMPEILQLEQRLQQTQQMIEMIKQRTTQRNYYHSRQLQEMISDRDQYMTNLRRV